MMRILGLCLILLAASGCAAMKTNEPARLRVMTYNIHHGEGTDGKLDLERIARLITENGADLVALQEVDRNVERTGKRDFPAELEKLTGMKCVFGKNIPLQGGEYGNAILSRFPISQVTNHWLPQIVPGEQRGILLATIRLGKAEVVFGSVHLDHRRGEEDRLASVEKIAALERAEPRPMIIAGDFNATPNSGAYRKMGEVLVDSWLAVGTGEGFTIPSEGPRSRIDYVWHSGVLRPMDAKVLRSPASDHLPLVVEFQLGRVEDGR